MIEIILRRMGSFFLSLEYNISKLKTHAMGVNDELRGWL